MAVIKVKVASIIGRMDELESVTEICGRSGVFHPDNALRFYDHTEEFTPVNEENPYASFLQRLSDALMVIKKEAQLLPESEIRKLQYTDEKAESYVDEVCDKLEHLQADRAATQKRIEECTQEAADMSHFVGQNLNLDEIRECKFIKVRFGSLPKSSSEQLDTAYKDNPYITFFPCTSDARNLWGVYMCPIDQSKEVDAIFRKLYFQRLRLHAITGTPEEMVKRLQAQIEEYKQHLDELAQQGEAFWEKERGHCTEVYSYLAERNTYFGVRHYAANYHDSFILTGWIPAESEHAFTMALDQLDSVEYSLEDADNELMHSPPVKLRNKALVRPYEFFVNMYGLPNYKEVDPTPLVAILYSVLFGIMFGDLGQGLCLSVFGYFYMWRVRKMPIGKVLLPCGIFAAIFGCVFGSVFGYEHTLDPLYRALGFAQKPINVMEGNTTMMIILISVAIGFVCISVAMILNIYSSLKRGNLARALVTPNGVAGLVFYWALVIGLVVQLLTGKKVLTAPYIIFLIILPLVVLFLQEMLTNLINHQPAKPEKMGEYLIQSFFELFETLLSLLSNTVSFLRVGAFVLVHSGMMTMVFTLAAMGGPDGSIGNLIIVIAGNIFVGVFEALLVGIHVLRLNFYEMFSRFYDGDGRPFLPVRVHGLQKA